MTTYNKLLIELKDKTLWVTINNENNRNSLDSEVLAELLTVFTEVEEDDRVGAIIIQGAGEKSFASGADIKQLHERDYLDNLKPGIQRVYNKIENCSKVTIAAIQGFALGGGFELALACDIRVAGENVKLGLPELNLGIIPGGGGTQRLARLIGKGRAMYLILTGDIIGAEQAKEYGIISDVIQTEQWEENLTDLSERIVAKGPLATKLAKLSINAGFDQSMETGLLFEKLLQTIAFSTEDRKEGMAAFLEKRKPKFQSK